MDSSSETISCDRLQVFNDDASTFTEAEAEFASSSRPRHICPSRRPTAKDTAAARACWLKIIRRFAKAVPGKKNLLRVQEGVTDQSCIWIKYPHPFSGTVGLRGEELDVADKTYLVVFLTRTDTNGTRIVSSAIPWFEIESIVFRLRQPEGPTAHAS
jgi:hypothetical protein